MEKVRIRTYRQVWRQEHVIYQVERVRLPFPISLRQAGVFAAAEGTMVILSKLPGALLITPVLRYGLLPVLVTWFITRQRLDGKPPLRWLASWLTYLTQPRRLNRFQPVRQQGRFRFRGRVGAARRRDEKDALSNQLL